MGKSLTSLAKVANDALRNFLASTCCQLKRAVRTFNTCGFPLFFFYTFQLYIGILLRVEESVTCIESIINIFRCGKKNNGMERRISFLSLFLIFMAVVPFIYLSFCMILNCVKVTNTIPSIKKVHQCQQHQIFHK